MIISPIAGLRIVIDDLPPTFNNAYPTAQHGRRFLTPAAKTWKAGAALQIRNAAALAGFSLPAKTPYYVDAEFFGPRVWGYDLDGRAKLLLDAISAALGVDDRYVSGL